MPSLNGPRFKNWTRGVGGGSAIYLVIHLQHLDLMTAIVWLAEPFGWVDLEPTPTLITQPLLHRSDSMYCGFDADPTLDQMAAAMIALDPTIKCLRPPAHD